MDKKEIDLKIMKYIIVSLYFYLSRVFILFYLSPFFNSKIKI